MVGQSKGCPMTSKRRDCRLMMCTTVLHGGVCHRTSTPHKSGIKMKEKKKKLSYTHLLRDVDVHHFVHLCDVVMSQAVRLK